MTRFLSGSLFVCGIMATKDGSCTKSNGEQLVRRPDTSKFLPSRFKVSGEMILKSTGGLKVGACLQCCRNPVGNLVLEG
ncbi:hypothetical protein B0J15DRAFT_480125 [Fusarium solani]|uniref:Secreted protein n=1 Tax=Fusarium solani TaxID=169388 RepID=A0A9P9L5E3_FUSSL|nr:uncharacterized protein B0J15DRAFT_480125 [Fusarium solani]KAH7274559.1 hypothetical protein B0J15DRAFT_480125 [Fusarium solani]